MFAEASKGRQTPKLAKLAKRPRGDKVRLPRELLSVLVDVGRTFRQREHRPTAFTATALACFDYCTLKSPCYPVVPTSSVGVEGLDPPGGYRSPVLGAISFGEHCVDLGDWYDGRPYGVLK